LVYNAIERANVGGSGGDPLAVVQKAVENVKPRLEVKSRRVGGATYQVPVETTPERQLSLALRWIVELANKRKGVAFEKALAQEIRDAATGQGNAVKKRDETHRMAQANRAFAHLRW
jgi:small subunit ribosomal protein S7